MSTALPVCDQAMIALKPFCAFNTIELTKTRKILCGLRAFVLLKMLWREEIGRDLIQIPQAPPGLRDR